MKKINLFFWIIILIVTISPLQLNAQNPFLKDNNRDSTEQTESSEKRNTINQEKDRIPYPQCFRTFLLKITLLQKTIREELSQFGRNIKDNPFGKAFWMFLLFSFIYGIIHALGPGHGKSIVCSYFLNQPGKYFHGIMMGNCCAFVHSFSSVVIISGFYLFFKTTGLIQFETASLLLSKISYFFLLIIGIFLLAFTVFNFMNREKVFNRNLQIYENDGDIRLMLITAFASGIIPCPGSALILIFSITQGFFFQGIIAMVFIALGMGFTTSFFATLTIMSRNSIFYLTERNKSLFLIIYLFLSLMGSLIVMLTGVLCLLFNNA